MTSSEAVAWVDSNKAAIRGLARKYTPFTPYEVEDYLQDAYEAAILSAAVAEGKGLPFHAFFWRAFRRKVADVTPNPSSTRHAGSTSPASRACSDIAPLAERLRPGTTGVPEQAEVDIERLFKAVGKYLTRAELRVWHLALGINQGQLNNYEIARELGCSPANVRQALIRSLKRLEELVEKGELRLEIEDFQAGHHGVISALQEEIRSASAPASRRRAATH